MTVLEAFLERSTLGALPEYIPGVTAEITTFGCDLDELEMHRLITDPALRLKFATLIRDDIDEFTRRKSAAGFSVRGIGFTLRRLNNGRIRACASVQVIPEGGGDAQQVSEAGEADGRVQPWREVQEVPTG